MLRKFEALRAQFLKKKVKTIVFLAEIQLLLRTILGFNIGRLRRLSMLLKNVYKVRNKTRVITCGFLFFQPKFHFRSAIKILFYISYQSRKIEKNVKNQIDCEK